MEKLSRLECPNDIWQIFIVLYKEECRLKLETLTEPVWVNLKDNTIVMQLF